MHSTALMIIIAISMASPMFATHSLAQSPATINDTPIRDVNSTVVPSGVITTSMGDYIWWSDETDEHRINETDEVSYYFEINQRLLGSTGIIFLEIVDKLFDLEPDLDIYLFNPSNELVDFSNESGDEDELIIVEFDEIGTWELYIYDFDGDGYYVLFRDVYSNSAPLIITENLNAENPYIYDPVYIDACESYDPDHHEIQYTWFVDGVEKDNDDDGDGTQDCAYGFEFTSMSTSTIKVRVTDAYGLYTEEQTTITPSNPGWDVKALGNSVSVDIDDNLLFTFYDLAPPMQTPIRSEGIPVTLQIGLKYEIMIDSDIEYQLQYDLVTGPQHSLTTLQHQLNNYDQTVSFKPSLVFNLEYGTSTYALDIPMISNEALYTNQPYFNIANYSLGLYYWADFVDLETTSIDGMFEYFSSHEFNLASIDLYPILEWMVDNLAASLGQGWVDTATNLLSKLVDIAIPLEFNVDIFAYGVNLIQTKPSCDTCQISSFFNVGPHELQSYTNSTEIVYSGDYELKVAFGLLSYFYVEATPNIDISLEVNDVRIWNMDLFDFETLTNEFLSSTSSGSHVTLRYQLDSDNDGVPDVSDFLPTDPSQQSDIDGDGCGDNADGTNGDEFPNDPTECKDADGDGVGDNLDQFPTDQTEWRDSDNDGVGDNKDVFPFDSTESMDSDSDGVGDNSDAFPTDASESKDSDNDGVGDNADAFPTDSTESADTDNDGVGDNSDAFPTDASESKDSDNDGVGDNADAFPTDSTESADTDNDGVGDNADAYPEDPTKSVQLVKTDSEGLPFIPMWMTLSSIFFVFIFTSRRYE